MGSSDIRDLLTSFSPSLDQFAINSGDGRIKIWDTLKGQIQTEFVDIVSAEGTDLFSKSDKGHLSVDYTCMKWLTLDRKKKRKFGSSLLILGTGGGDVMALDVSAGQLKWRISDCHPGGVTSVSSSIHGLSVYTAGADGMICEIDSLTGNLLGKFRASAKAISRISVSSDGKLIATAAAQLKIFNCPDHKKIQKFSGHPGAVRCMIFSENGKYILSSAVGERYIAVWKLDGSKKRSASGVLALEHPAVFLDSRGTGNGPDDEGLYVLAISEIGVCYFWYARNIEELRNSKPTKISISSEDIFSKNLKGATPTIFAAKLQGIAKPSSGHALVACGLPVRPSFQKILVHYGTDIKLNSSQDGVLLPLTQSRLKSKKGIDVQNAVTALDRANAEDALLPIPKIFGLHEEKKGRSDLRVSPDEIMVDTENQTMNTGSEDLGELGGNTICMEDRLRALGILTCKDDITTSPVLNSTKLMGIDLEANLPGKKMRAAVLSMAPSDAYKLLGMLVVIWQSRSNSGKYVLPWIYSILVNHSPYVVSQELETQILNSLHKVTKSRGVAIQPLLQLSGRLQLVMAQIDKAYQNKTQTLAPDHQMDETEDEDEDVDEILYGEEDEESQISHDDEE